MEKDKVRDNFINMIKESWTYARLTEEEKNRILEVICSTQTENCLKGTATHRWQILQAIYHSFLMGLDYTPIGWREEQEEMPLF